MEKTKKKKRRRNKRANFNEMQKHIPTDKQTHTQAYAINIYINIVKGEHNIMKNTQKTPLIRI